MSRAQETLSLPKTFVQNHILKLIKMFYFNYINLWSVGRCTGYDVYRISLTTDLRPDVSMRRHSRLSRLVMIVLLTFQGHLNHPTCSYYICLKLNVSDRHWSDLLLLFACYVD